LYLIFIFTIDEHQWWRRGGLTPWDGVWESNGEFYNRKDQMKPSKLRR
jgi:hypothetical protein